MSGIHCAVVSTTTCLNHCVSDQVVPSVRTEAVDVTSTADNDADGR